MQGLTEFIPTKQKVKYINQLLKVGFDTIDFGSFVSPKAIPQMADTREVISNLELGNTKSKLLAIIANERGATDAVVYDIVYVPLETRLLRDARMRGLRTVDGLGMLLHQAVPGFHTWFGVKPEVTPELRALIEADIARA